MSEIIKKLEELTGTEILLVDVESGDGTFELAVVTDDRETWATDARRFDAALVDIVSQADDRFNEFCDALPLLSELTPYHQDIAEMLEGKGYELTLV